MRLSSSTAGGLRWSRIPRSSFAENEIYVSVHRTDPPKRVFSRASRLQIRKHFSSDDRKDLQPGNHAVIFVAPMTSFTLKIRKHFICKEHHRIFRVKSYLLPKALRGVQVHRQTLTSFRTSKARGVLHQTARTLQSLFLIPKFFTRG